MEIRHKRIECLWGNPPQLELQIILYSFYIAVNEPQKKNYFSFFNVGMDCLGLIERIDGVAKPRSMMAEWAGILPAF